MANQDLVKFISDETAAGHSEESIRAGLKGKGWADSDIDMAYSAHRAQQAGPVLPAGKPKVGRFVQESWDLLNRMVPTIVDLYKSFLVPGVILFAVLFGIGFLSGTSEPNNEAINGRDFGIGIAVMLVIALFFAYYSMWIQATLLLILRNKDAAETVRSIKARAKSLIFPLFGAAVLAGLYTALGFVAVIIPGIYLMVCYSVVQNVVVDQGKRGMAALRTSRAYVKGQWWSVFGSLAALLAINILVAAVGEALTKIGGDVVGSIFSLASNLVLFPFSTIYTFMLYERLKQMRPEVAGMYASSTPPAPPAEPTVPVMPPMPPSVPPAPPAA